MLRILIVGAGGHAKVVADAVATGQRATVVGFIEDDRQDGELPREHCGFPVHRDLAALGRVPHDAVVIAIGDNRTRRMKFLAAIAAGETLCMAVHSGAVVAASASIGAGTLVCAGAVVNPDSVVGANVILNTRSSIDHDCRIEDHVHVAPGVTIGGDVVVREGAFVGIGAVIKPGVTVGAWATVGAGAVVIRDVPEKAVVVGVPARQRGAAS